MHLLALTALTDPTTPPWVLELLATSDDPLVPSYVLAHPNTPDHVAAALDTPSQIDHVLLALHSAAATHATRDRLIARLQDGELGFALGLIDTRPSVHPQVLTHTIARHRAAPHTDLAFAFFDRVNVPRADAVAALHTLLDSWRTRQPTRGLAGRIAYAATGHPEQLADLTAHATAAARQHLSTSPERDGDAIVAIAASLRRLLGSPHPRATHLATVYPGGNPHERLADTPDPDLAAHLLSEHPDSDSLHHVIMTAPSLTGTPAWLRVRCGHVVQTQEATLDPDVALATSPLASTPDLAAAAIQPVNANPAVLHALAVAVAHRRAYPDPMAVEVLLGRLLAHPATPPADTDALRTQLAARFAPTSTPSIRDALINPRPLSQTVADLPLPSLTQAIRSDNALGTSLAVHARAATGPLWRTPHMARIALRLAGTFTGTLTDLQQVTHAVAA